MAKEIEITVTLEKIVRQNGKEDAQVVLTIPASAVSALTLGANKIKIQPLQSAMFGENEPVRGAKSPRG